MTVPTSTVDPIATGVDDGAAVTSSAADATPELPYGRRTLRVIRPLHDAFGPVNRWFAAPALRAGLGPLFSTPLTGSLMLLRTTGRRSGLAREAPLGYVIRDGSVYCCAGFGPRTAWYRNLVAEPRVEVILPTVAIAGLAEPVTDRAEWDRVFPAYARALGVIARLTLGDVASADAQRLDTLRAQLPLVRIRPTGLASGPADPGGRFWLVAQAVVLLVAARLVARVGRRFGWPRRS